MERIVARTRDFTQEGSADSEAKEGADVDGTPGFSSFVRKRTLNVRAIGLIATI